MGDEITYRRELRMMLAGLLRLRRTFIRGAIAAGPFGYLQYASDQWLEYCPLKSWPKGEGTRLEILFDCDWVVCKVKKGSDLDNFAYWHCPIRTLRLYERMLFQTWSYSDGRYLGNPEETACAYWIINDFWSERLEKIAHRLEEFCATQFRTSEGKTAFMETLPLLRNGTAKWAAGYVQWDYLCQLDSGIKQLRLRLAASQKKKRTARRRIKASGRDSHAASERLLLVAALMQHHRFDHGETNWEPATQKELEVLTGWNQSKVSRMMKTLFGNRPMVAYRRRCEQETIQGFLVRNDDGSHGVEGYAPSDDE